MQAYVTYQVADAACLQRSLDLHAIDHAETLIMPFSCTQLSTVSACTKHSLRDTPCTKHITKPKQGAAVGMASKADCSPDCNFALLTKLGHGF